MQTSHSNFANKTLLSSAPETMKAPSSVKSGSHSDESSSPAPNVERAISNTASQSESNWNARQDQSSQRSLLTSSARMTALKSKRLMTEIQARMDKWNKKSDQTQSQEEHAPSRTTKNNA